MKTAMQEHFEWLQENQLYFGIPIEAIDNAEDLLEKEKQQLEEARLKGYGEGLKDGNIEEGVFFDKPEDYHYYKTITNQNK
jgi:hypothetical protein